VQGCVLERTSLTGLGRLTQVRDLDLSNAFVRNAYLCPALLLLTNLERLSLYNLGPAEDVGREACTAVADLPSIAELRVGYENPDYSFLLSDNGLPLDRRGLFAAPCTWWGVGCAILVG
jgi:hypothetical protein